jgi:hypothetical protein
MRHQPRMTPKTCSRHVCTSSDLLSPQFGMYGNTVPDSPEVITVVVSDPSDGRYHGALLEPKSASAPRQSEGSRRPISASMIRIRQAPSRLTWP